MNTRQLTTEINLPAPIFIELVRKKVAGYKRSELDSFFSFPPHLELENVSISNEKLIIEKSAKPLDKFSRYSGISGTIQSEIMDRNGMTELKSEIRLDTAVADFFQYSACIAIASAGLTWLILDFKIIVLIGLLVLEVLLFGFAKLSKQAAIDNLNRYYDHMITELTTE